jgi:hypothetical protein
MEKDDRKHGEPTQAAGSRQPQPASRPAAGKVTRTSKASPRPGAAVQRKAVASPPDGDPVQRRSLWDLTMDPAMDAAHRGVTALAEGNPGSVQAHGAGTVVQRKSVVQKDEDPAAPAPAPAPADLTPLTGEEVILSRDPGDTTEDYLEWFRGDIKKAVEPWGLPFDPAAVRVAGETVDSALVPVVALRWNDAWGARPSTPSTSWVFSSMAPISATAAVTAVQTWDGWSALSAADRAMLLELLGAETNRLSQTARAHLGARFLRLSTQPAVRQATVLAALVSTEGAMPPLVDDPVSATPVEYELQGPTTHPAYTFHGITADAEAWTARFSDGLQIFIVAPRAPQVGYHQHTVEGVAKTLVQVPRDARSIINTVVLNPVSNPDDAYWAVEYDEADFHAYMTAGAAGVVTIYPLPSAPGESGIPGAVIHESGHTWSRRNWGEDTTQGKWIEWQAAMDSDKVAVSGYSHKSPEEDVAETIHVYVGTQGTPQFDEYRSLVPHRFAMLDREYP